MTLDLFRYGKGTKEEGVVEEKRKMPAYVHFQRLPKTKRLYNAHRMENHIFHRPSFKCSDNEAKLGSLESAPSSYQGQ
jgi:hypothetical protein